MLLLRFLLFAVHRTACAASIAHIPRIQPRQLLYMTGALLVNLWKMWADYGGALDPSMVLKSPP
jgi:hypothetical protein